jgi:5'-nucleotidase
MKQLGYDVSCLGNHEFDYGPAGLAATVQSAQAGGGLPTLVSSNIHFAGTAADAPLQALFDETGSDPSKPIHRSFVVTTASGIKVGFVGILGAVAAYNAVAKAPITFSVAPGSTDSDTKAALGQIYADLQPVVSHLRNDLKVDLVVALSHSGVELDDIMNGEDVQIAQNVPGIDVIVSGHTHTLLPAMTVTNTATGAPVIVQQAGQYGQYVGRLQLDLSSDGKVTLDSANTTIVNVDDTIVPDATYQPALDSTIAAVEALQQGGKGFLTQTLGEIMGAPVSSSGPSSLFFYPIANTAFDVLAQKKHVETAGEVLIADAMLAAAEQYGGPTNVAIIASGEIDGDLFKGQHGSLTFNDVFRTLPLGVSPGDGTLGYPLARAGLFAIELKDALEISASFSFPPSNQNAQFMVTSGLRYSFDTSRPPFNLSDPKNPLNGRITKIEIASNHAQLDTYDKVIFDVSQGGFVGGSPVDVYSITTTYYLASYAASRGITLKTPDGITVYSDAKQAILKRTDGSEVKEWEALGAYLRTQAAGNGGTLPAQYNAATPGGTVPRRTVCVGMYCVN